MKKLGVIFMILLMSANSITASRGGLEITKKPLKLLPRSKKSKGSGSKREKRQSVLKFMNPARLLQRSKKKPGKQPAKQPTKQPAKLPAKQRAKLPAKQPAKQPQLPRTRLELGKALVKAENDLERLSGDVRQTKKDFYTAKKKLDQALKNRGDTLEDPSELVMFENALEAWNKAHRVYEEKVGEVEVLRTLYNSEQELTKETAKRYLKNSKQVYEQAKREYETAAQEVEQAFKAQQAYTRAENRIPKNPLQMSGSHMDELLDAMARGGDNKQHYKTTYQNLQKKKALYKVSKAVLECWERYIQQLQ